MLWRERILLAALAVLPMTLLIVAAQLDPSPTGFGTHQALGLPPCSVQRIMGLRCPACGMTTSWAYLVRGRLWSSVEANSGGFLLGLLSIWAAPICAYKCWTGIEFESGWFGRISIVMLVVVFSVTLLDWLIRILT